MNHHGENPLTLLPPPADSGTGVFQDGNLVGVVTHAGNRGGSKLLMCTPLDMLQKFLADVQSIHPVGGDYHLYGDLAARTMGQR